MNNSMWCYPWDLVDCNISKVLDELKENSFNSISIISSYHAGRFLCVRSPKRKIYFPEDGVLYYEANLDNYKNLKIQPKVAEFVKDNKNFWQDLHREAKQRDMAINAWTVCLHNTRIGMEYPSTCVHNAYGDVVYYNQCPSNEDARKYMCALVNDICEQVKPDAIELESMNYMGHAHEFHHEKDGIGLTALQDFLLSLCFCDSCVQKATQHGVDIKKAQSCVKQMLNDMCNQDTPPKTDKQFLSEGIAFFKNDDPLYAYLQWRSSSVTSLVKKVCESVNKRSKVHFLSLLPHSGSWLFGVDLKEISRICDGVLVCSYDCDETKAFEDITECKSDFSEKTKLFVGMRLFMPEYKNEQEFVKKVQTVNKLGVDGFVFYNYGLIPPAHLKWAKVALSQL